MDQDLIRNVMTVIQIVGGGFCVVIWHNFVGISTRLRQCEATHQTSAIELAAYKLHVAETYMTNKAMESMMAKLDRIEDKLDKKQDKT